MIAARTNCSGCLVSGDGNLDDPVPQQGTAVGRRRHRGGPPERAAPAPLRTALPAPAAGGGRWQLARRGGRAIKLDTREPGTGSTAEASSRGRRADLDASLLDDDL